MNETLAVAALLGAATGIRSTAGFAILASTRARPTGSRLRDERLRRTLEAALLGEMIADKAAELPPRTHPLPWMGRVVLGGAAAAVAASWTSSSRAGAALVGGLVAAVTTWAATRLRHAAEERGAPDVLPASAEDVAVLGLGVATDQVLRGRADSAA